jgi:tetratricopeptide (TPR) repeat protein
VVLQDYRPLAESLDWELGQAAWASRASRAFLADRVPLMVTSDGWLAHNAAEVLCTALDAARDLPALIPVLEIGVGHGLFARAFLSEFQGICKSRGKDYYGRLQYVAADKSQPMLDDLARHGMLDAHAGRHQFCRVDAERIGADLAPLVGQGGPAEGGFCAVFLNYMLDSLPAAVLRLDGQGASQLCVRTSLARGIDLRDFTPLTVDEVRERAASTDPARRAELVGLYRVLALACEFRPLALDALPHAPFAVRQGAPGQYVLHSYGAIECLRALRTRLQRGGFILLSDYGQTGSAASNEPWEHQRFGPTAAIGLNFALLGAFFQAAPGCDWVAPPADPDSLICRLVGWGLDPAVGRAFQRLSDKATREWCYRPLEKARAFADKKRTEAALDAFALAVERLGANWAVFHEAARYLIYTVEDYARGHEMARLALAQHPISPALWNILGDALYYLGRKEEAHEAFLRALEFNPDDARAHLNLAYTHMARRDPTAALHAVAEGLRCDRAGKLRDSLLKQQERVLSALTRRHEQEELCVAGRSGRSWLWTEPMPTGPGSA